VAGAIAAAVVAVCMLLAGAAGSAAASPRARVDAVVQQLAAANGDTSPWSITYVRTTRAVALHLMGEMSSGNPVEPVYVAVARGRFNGAAASHPAGAPAPHGTTLVVVLDAQTYQVTDWGLGNTVPDLSRLAGAAGSTGKQVSL
jgi:hypothetical protein